MESLLAGSVAGQSRLDIFENIVLFCFFSPFFKKKYARNVFESFSCPHLKAKTMEIPALQGMRCMMYEIIVFVNICIRPSTRDYKPLFSKISFCRALFKRCVFGDRGFQREPMDGVPN